MIKCDNFISNPEFLRTYVGILEKMNPLIEF